MSDTPRTDAAAETIASEDNVRTGFERLYAHARTLEREAAALREKLELVREWPTYANLRSNTLENDKREFPVDSDTFKRLETKAGMFRSLAHEVESLVGLPETNPNASQPLTEPANSDSEEEENARS